MIQSLAMQVINKNSSQCINGQLLSSLDRPVGQVTGCVQDEIIVLYEYPQFSGDCWSITVNKTPQNEQKPRAKFVQLFFSQIIPL